MSKNAIKKSLAVAMGATFAAAMSASPIVNADSNPFGMNDLSSGYMQVAEKGKEEGKCGEGKCGEGKMKKEGKCGEGKMDKEGKCGEGKMKKEEASDD